MRIFVTLNQGDARMRVDRLLATDPNDGQYANLVKEAYISVSTNRLQAAIAYATQSGVAELCRVLDDVPEWHTARKKWLVGIDYCRSDPSALAHLQGLPRSEVRIHDGEFVCRRVGCTPRVSYHPKLYIFNGPDSAAIVLGSGNLSQTGLRRGVEAAASLRDQNLRQMAPISRWHRRLWNDAAPLSEIEAAYTKEYSSYINRQQPAPIDDDAVPSGAGLRGQLTPTQLRQLRVCQHLWIEAGNLHLNRGIGQPGNQLMLKRNTRIFFGFQARDLDPDTTIGTVAIQYGAHERHDCSLRFSNNSMDVLTLPIPGEEGPDQYDQKVLLFNRVGVRRFELKIGSAGQISSWRRSSERIDAAHKMRSGRCWGVF